MRMSRHIFVNSVKYYQLDKSDLYRKYDRYCHKIDTIVLIFLSADKWHEIHVVASLVSRSLHLLFLVLNHVYKVAKLGGPSNNGTRKMEFSSNNRGQDGEHKDLREYPLHLWCRAIFLMGPVDHIGEHADISLVVAHVPWAHPVWET